MQRWSRAYRDDEYHAAVDTSNGVEAQNKLLKYNYLPRGKQRINLSNIVTIIVEQFLPSCQSKYLFQNYKQSSQYRSYKKFVPTYLHDRPHSVILHCLERKSKSAKYAVDSVHDVDPDLGIFKIEKDEKTRYTVKFGTSDDMPSCTCKDWLRYHIPCKHFFAIFTHRPNWSWDQLPSTYQNSAYVSMDTLALDPLTSLSPSHPSTTWPSEECSDGQSSREDCDDNQQQECSDDQHQDFREQPTSSELPTKVSIYSQVVLIIHQILTGTQMLPQDRSRKSEDNTERVGKPHIQLW